MSYDSDNTTNEGIYLSDQYSNFENSPVSDEQEDSESSWEDSDLSEDPTQSSGDESVVIPPSSDGHGKPAGFHINFVSSE
jgi:hypothetical protein